MPRHSGPKRNGACPQEDKPLLRTYRDNYSFAQDLRAFLQFQQWQPQYVEREGRKTHVIWRRDE